jgi:hypothetical protein
MLRHYSGVGHRKTFPSRHIERHDLVFEGNIERLRQPAAQRSARISLVTDNQFVLHNTGEPLDDRLDN